MTNPLATEIVDDWILRPQSLLEAVHSSEGCTRWRNDDGDFLGPMYVAELQIPSNREQLEKAQLILASLKHLSTLQSSDRTTEFLQKQASALYPYIESMCTGDQDKFVAHAPKADNALRAIHQRFIFGPAGSGHSPKSASRAAKKNPGRKEIYEPKREAIISMYEGMNRVSYKEIASALDLKPLGGRSAKDRVRSVINTYQKQKKKAGR